MKAAQLHRKSRKQLTVLAKAAGIRVKQRATREELIKAILAVGAKPLAKSNRPNELPCEYGRSRLVLMEVEPRLIHAYWEVTPGDIRAVAERLGVWSRFASWNLRFYDVTCIDFDGTNFHSFFDVPVDLASGNWYVHLWEGDKTYVAEIGPRAPNGRFIPVSRSDFATMPRTGPSPRYAPQWLKVEAGRGEIVEEPSAGSEPVQAPEPVVSSVPTPDPGETHSANYPVDEQRVEILPQSAHFVQGTALPPEPASLSSCENEGSEAHAPAALAAEPVAGNRLVALSSETAGSFGLGSGGAVFPFARTSAIERQPALDPAHSGNARSAKIHRVDERWVEGKPGKFHLQPSGHRTRPEECRPKAPHAGKQRQ